jgi:hypothetical protein
VKLHHLSPIFFVFAMSSAACSSSSSDTAVTTPCNVDPWQCPTGQTCWPKDQTGAFACLNSAAGKAKGDACTNTVGSPTCGDGLACFQGVGDSSGKCVPFCDNATAGRGCGAGETCSTVTLAGTSNSFHVCIGTSTPMDSGTETSTDTGSEDTGSAADSASSDASGETATDASSD